MLLFRHATRRRKNRIAKKRQKSPRLRRRRMWPRSRLGTVAKTRALPVRAGRESGPRHRRMRAVTSTPPHLVRRGPRRTPPLVISTGDRGIVQKKMGLRFLEALFSQVCVTNCIHHGSGSNRTHPLSGVHSCDGILPGFVTNQVHTCCWSGSRCLVRLPAKSGGCSCCRG